MPTIYILLPVHNRCDVTREFVKSLKRQTYTDYHLILIDDGSSDGTADMVAQEIKSLSVLTGKGDWWWAGCLQQGYNWLQQKTLVDDDIVLIVNDDTVFEPDYLSTAVSLLETLQSSLLLSYYYSQQSGELIDSGVHVDWANCRHNQAKNADEINCLSTRGLFMRASDFLDIGGFYPDLLPHYASDYEFTIRAHNLGYNLISHESLKLWGNELTTGHNDISSVSTYSAIKMIFSLKSNLNPIVRTRYVLMACPLRWRLSNVLSVWWNVFRIICKSLWDNFKAIFVVNKNKNNIL